MYINKKQICDNDFCLSNLADETTMLGLKFKGNDELKSPYINHITTIYWCQDSVQKLKRPRNSSTMGVGNQRESQLQLKVKL